MQKSHQANTQRQSQMDRQQHDRKEGQLVTAVWRNGGCSASYDSFVVGSSAVLRLNFCAKNPPLRQAANRYATFKMDNKQLKDLTADDLIGKPIWEFWISDNIEYVREAFDNEITEDSHVSYIVLTEFIFNNKTKHIGFCSPQDSSGLDYIQPVVFADTEQVNFYINNGLTKNEKNELMSKLGYTWKDIFPIVYSTKIKCNGEYYNGLITDFNEGR